ncbi:MAG: flagellar hook-basal body protein [Thermoguttaceae bacterium]
MSYGLYVSSEGAHAQEYRIRTIANNIANVETPAFKRELALQIARPTERVLLGEDSPYSGTFNELSGGNLTIGTKTEFAQGPIKETGNKTDLAIEGEGWFRVRDMSNGKEFLTRAGMFVVRNDGMLVTEQGRSRFSVLDNEGEPVIIDTNDPTWNFSDDGVVLQNGARAQALSLVIPSDMTQMVKVGETMYRNEAKQTEIPSESRRRVMNEHLEGSATNPSTEMIELIVASRALEMNVKMMQSQDELTNGLINKMLKVG